MHFSSAVSSIQSHVGQIKGVEISYCDKNPLAYDLSIKLSQDGLKLVFDSTSQRLKVIEVYDLSLLRLKYGYVPAMTLAPPESNPIFIAGTFILTAPMCPPL